MDAQQKPTDTAKIDPTTPPIAPMAMAELAIMEAQATKSAAAKSPAIRNIALLLAVVVGVQLLSQIGMYAIVASFDTTQTSFLSFFANTNGVLGSITLLIQIIAICALLFTRNTSHAKTIILVAGIGFAITLVNGIFSFQIGPTIIANAAALVVDFFIVRKIFYAYLDL